MKKSILAIIFVSISLFTFSQTVTEYSNRGDSKYKLKDYIGAIQDCSKLIELDSKYELVYMMRGECKIKLRDIEGACLDFSKAGELGYEKAYDEIEKYCK